MMRRDISRQWIAAREVKPIAYPKLVLRIHIDSSQSNEDNAARVW